MAIRYGFGGFLPVHAAFDAINYYRARNQLDVAALASDANARYARNVGGFRAKLEKLAVPDSDIDLRNDRRYVFPTLHVRAGDRRKKSPHGSRGVDTSRCPGAKRCFERAVSRYSSAGN